MTCSPIAGMGQGGQCVEVSFPPRRACIPLVCHIVNVLYVQYATFRNCQVTGGINHE